MTRQDLTPPRVSARSAMRDVTDDSAGGVAFAGGCGSQGAVEGIQDLARVGSLGVVGVNIDPAQQAVLVDECDGRHRQSEATVGIGLAEVES